MAVQPIMAPLASAGTTFLGGLTGGINWTLVIALIIILALILISVFVWQKTKGNKDYNILVKVIPKWSFKESMKKVLITPKPSLFNKHPKEEYQEVPVQEYSVYYVPGKYQYNKHNGVHELKLKDKEKTVISDIGYKYFKPILFGKFNRTITLFRASPEDYKPCEVTIEGGKEILHIYDSESLYADLRAQEDIENRFRKQNKIMQFLPFIIAFLCIIAMIIFGVIIKNGLDNNAKSLGGLGSQLANATKMLAVSCRGS